MYQLIEKVIGNNQNFNISQSSLDLSIILFLELKHLLNFHTVYTLHLQATTSMTTLRLILDHKPSAIQSI